MRKRRWALFAFIFLIAFVFIGLESWKIVKANEKLKALILDELRPVLGSQLYIRHVHVSFGNIHLLNVRVPVPGRPVDIYIKDLRLGYSFLNLLVRGFDIQRISHDALFIEPHIVFYAPSADSLDHPIFEMDGASAPKSIERTNGGTRLFKLFHYVSLKRGKISYEWDDSTSVVLAQSLQGGIFRQRGDSLFVSLSGSFYQSTNSNITLVGYGDAEHLFFDRLKINLEKYSLSNGLPFPPLKTVDPRAGQIIAEIDVTYDVEKRRYQASAFGEIFDAAGSLWDQRFQVEHMNCRFRFQNGTFYIDSSEQWIANSPLTVSGKIETQPKPVFDLTVDSPELSLETIAPIFSKNKISGKCSLQGHIYGQVSNPFVDGRLASRRLIFDGLPLEHLSSSFSFREGQLLLQPLRARAAEYDLEYRGGVDLASAPNALRGTIRGSGFFAPRPSFFGADSTLQVAIETTADLSGTLQQPVVSGFGTFNFLSQFRAPVLIPAEFSYVDKTLRFSMQPLSEQSTFFAKVDLGLSPAGLEVDVQRAEELVGYFFHNPRIEGFLKNIAATVSLTGTTRQIKVNTTLSELVDGFVDSPLCNLDFDINRNAKTTETFGRFVLYPGRSNLRGAVNLVQSADGWSLERFTLGQLDASLKADFSKQSLKGQVQCANLDLAALFDDSDALPKGFLSAKIDIAGSPNTPKVRGNIELDRLLYQGLGPYHSFVDFNYDSSRLHLDRLLLNLAKSTLLFAQGDYRPKSGTLDFTLKGAGFDAENIYRAVGKDTLISGQTLVDLRIRGSLAAPTVDGLVAVKNGRFWHVPFDEVELRLGQEQDDGPPRIHLKSFRMTRLPEYELSASGYYPLDGADSLSLDIDGSGNFLAILSDLTPFFKNPRSICTVSARLRGTPSAPRIAAAKLRINQAEMGFASVVSPLTDLNGELEFSPEEQFLRLAFLTGRMGGKPFHIHTAPAQRIQSLRPLQNMTLFGARLNFGVIVLETPERGVPLNFVGLMEPKKFGLLDLRGREDGEKFYFAQSPEGLTLRGHINLSEADIMYPFYESSGKASPKVTEFLENLIWDISVRPVKNTRFVRTFPGAIDEVYINLKIDEQYGGLDFSGRIADETFRINGQLRSTKGFIEYLDMNFRVEQAGVEFDRSSLMPVVYGQARAAVTDSLGISSNIILTMQTVDNTMDKKSVDDIVRQEQARARFDRIRFKLSSDNPNLGTNEAQIMASLGYSPSSLRGGALGAISMGADNMLLRPLFRPFERELENALRLDYVRFSSPLTRNILQFNLNNNLDLNRRLALLESTKIIVGKYISNRLFFQYTGQIESGVGYRYKDKDLGFHHTIGLDYQINPQVLLELEYDYDSLMMYNREDKRIVVRHWFPF